VGGWHGGLIQALSRLHPTSNIQQTVIKQMNIMTHRHIHPSTKSLVLSLVAAAGLAASNSAHAALVFTLTETGSGVTLVGSGSFNFGGSLDVQTVGFGAEIRPSQARFEVGPFVGGNYNIATNAIVSGPDSFGLGGFTVPTTGSGDTFGVRGLADDVTLPFGYISGTGLNGQSFYSGATLASLGATPGTYVWQTSFGGVDDSLTLDVIPEPSSLALLGLGGLALLRRRR
jgi:hypothetical protein